MPVRVRWVLIALCLTLFSTGCHLMRHGSSKANLRHAREDLPRVGFIQGDSSLREFNDYFHGIYTQIAAQWTLLVGDGEAPPEDREARVVVEIAILSNGELAECRTVETTATRSGTLLCEDSIRSRAPFAPFLPEMIERYGAEKSVTLTFLYRNADASSHRPQLIYAP